MFRFENKRSQILQAAANTYQFLSVCKKECKKGLTPLASFQKKFNVPQIFSLQFFSKTQFYRLIIFFLRFCIFVLSCSAITKNLFQLYFYV